MIKQKVLLNLPMKCCFQLVISIFCRMQSAFVIDGKCSDYDRNSIQNKAYKAHLMAEIKVRNIKTESVCSSSFNNRKKEG